MNLGQGESCEPQTSQLLLFLNQQGSPGPHPTPGSATSASGQSHRHPGTARPPPPGVPQLSAGTASPGHAYRQPRVLWLCRSAPRDTCRMLRVMSRPPEQVVFQVSWSAGFFKWTSPLGIIRCCPPEIRSAEVMGGSQRSLGIKGDRRGDSRHLESGSLLGVVRGRCWSLWGLSSNCRGWKEAALPRGWGERAGVHEMSLKTDEITGVLRGFVSKPRTSQCPHPSCQGKWGRVYRSLISECSCGLNLTRAFLEP